jgi:hypothetical protein
MNKVIIFIGSSKAKIKVFKNEKIGMDDQEA